MKTSTDDAIRTLNTLLAICRDSELGFHTAACSVTAPELARVFAEYAAQRSKLIRELQERIRDLRSDPSQAGAGTLGGSLHRQWMKLETALAANELHTVLAECERGEDIATAAYAEALQNRDVDESTRRLIQCHYELVQAAHDRIRQLRDSESYAYR